MKLRIKLIENYKYSVGKVRKLLMGLLVLQVPQGRKRGGAKKLNRFLKV